MISANFHLVKLDKMPEYSPPKINDEPAKEPVKKKNEEKEKYQQNFHSRTRSKRKNKKEKINFKTGVCKHHQSFFSELFFKKGTASRIDGKKGVL